MGAGIIVVNKIGRILSLIREDGSLDLPKGTKDKNETVFECAQRETYEECDLWYEFGDMLGKVSTEELTLFVTVDKGQTPRVKPNPHTGKYEHIGYQWVSPKEFISRCLPYIVPYIEKYFYGE